MRSNFLATLAVAVVAALGTAQSHPNGYAGSTSSGRVFLFGQLGGVTTLTLGSGTGYGLVMGARNRELLAADSNGIYRIDPKTGVSLGTLLAASGLYDLVVDGHGQVFASTSAGTILKINRVGVATTVVTGLTSLNGGMTIDPTTGDLLAQSSSSSDPLLRITRNGQSITTVGTGFDARYGVDFHIPTGDVFSGTCCGDFTPAENVFYLPSGTSVASVYLSTAAPPVGVYSLECDRASAANDRLVLGAFAPSSTARGPGGIYHLDLATKMVTTFSPLASGLSLYETEILYRRNVHTVRTARGNWDVGIRIPEDAGKAYQLAVSATGIRPAVRLPGSRRAYLTPDTLTFTGLSTGLAPFLVNTRGTLNASGDAIARLDLTALGSAVNGLRLYFLAVTFGSGPGGIVTITDPTVLEVAGI